MKRFGEIRLPFDHGRSEFERALAVRGIESNSTWRILRKSLDARRKSRIAWVYTIGVLEPGDDDRPVPMLRIAPDPRPVIIGAGPAGLFVALWLADHGVKAVILEQGDAMPERVLKMARFMRLGELDERSNLGFGAGGAGAYSDGKLLTRIRSPHIQFVMDTFVNFGAPDEIRYLADPHLGSSRIRRIIHAMIEHLQSLGVEIRFRNRVDGFEMHRGQVSGVQTEDASVLSASAVFLALGHSARSLYRACADVGVEMEFKPFAAGLRLEHPVARVDSIQFGKHAGDPRLGAARYRLAHTWDVSEGKRVLYSFCMCPGGYVLNATTESSGVVSNGMSNPGRRGRFSNAALVVNVEGRDIEGDGLFRGMTWQQNLESDARRAANSGGGCHALPGQRLVDFLASRPSTTIEETSCPCPVVPARLDQILPDFIVDGLHRGIETFERRMRGFICEDAILVGVESRTSAPVRLVRDRETRQSTSVEGLYPVGEGAGYAGGITSAAVDGIASAEAFLRTLPEKG
ncbi:MAG: hypothetical protein GY906_17525 [bacterium]|nr:hypothetical protein [bacterium]